MGGVGFDEQTPEQINIYCPTRRSALVGTSVQVRYRAAGASAWRLAHPLVPIVPTDIESQTFTTLVPAFAGTIFDLVPGTNYEVELTVNEPGAALQVLTANRATRALPGAAGAATKTASPGEDLQARFNSLVPGDVLVLANGTYNVSNLYINVQGTASRPIYIRGASRNGVIIRDTTDAVIETRNVSHLVIEDLTLVGSGVDSGTAASSTGILQWNGASVVPTNVTVRRVTMNGVDRGVITYSSLTGWLVYHCTLNGNNTWDKSYTVPAGETYTPLTWNDDGIRISGLGCCAWENTLRGFGDAFATAVSATYPLLTAAVHYYRNKILMTGDDAWEADYGTRNISFYDNYIGNSGTFFSADPIYGGPAYCFRNISINSWRGPFKWNSMNSGILVYNNTIIKTGNKFLGIGGWLWNQNNNGEQRNWSFRNNLIYKTGSSENTNILFFDAGGSDKLDLTHNGWFPDGAFGWRDAGTYNSLSAVRSSLPALSTFMGNRQRHDQDMIVASNVFDPAISLTVHTTEYTAHALPTLRAGTSARNSGVAIPGITDNFSGAAPDRGALISGRPAGLYGDPNG